jgi:O-antigen ligase
MLTRPILAASAPRAVGGRARAIRTHLVMWVLLVAISGFIGASIAGRTQVYVGDRPALIVIAMAGAGALFVTFGAIGFPVLAVWATLTGIAYPFVKFGTLVTFDRLWVIGMLGCLALTRNAIPRSRESRAVLLALGLLAATFGLRAVATHDGTLGPVQLWIDAIALPLILFATTRALVRDHRRATQVAASLMVGGGILAVLGLATVVAGLDLAKYSGGNLRLESGLDVYRLSGPYPVPEPYALSLLVCLAATFYWLLSRRTDGSRLVGLAFTALQLAAIGLTLFRAAWIGAVFIIVAAFGLRPHRFGRLLLVAALVGAVLLGATTQLQHTALFKQRVDNTDNVWGRLATYEQGLHIFRGSPVFGVGVDQYHTVSSGLPPVAVKGVDSVTYAHSSFVGLLAEQGIVGFVPFALLCFFVVRLLRASVRRSASRDDAALAGAASGAALAYFVMSATLTMLPYGPSIAFFAVLLGLVAARLDQSDAEKVPGGAPTRPTVAAVRV